MPRLRRSRNGARPALRKDHRQSSRPRRSVRPLASRPWARGCRYRRARRGQRRAPLSRQDLDKLMTTLDVAFVRPSECALAAGRPHRRLHRRLLSSRRRIHPPGRRNPHTPDAAHAGDRRAGASNDGRRDGARPHRGTPASTTTAASHRGRRSGTPSGTASRRWCLHAGPSEPTTVRRSTCSPPLQRRSSRRSTCTTGSTK